MGCSGLLIMQMKDLNPPSVILVERLTADNQLIAQTELLELVAQVCAKLDLTCEQNFVTTSTSNSTHGLQLLSLFSFP